MDPERREFLRDFMLWFLSLFFGPIVARLSPASRQSIEAAKERLVERGLKDFKLTMCIRGFEVTEDWYSLMANNPEVRDTVMQACGIRFALQGANPEDDHSETGIE